MQNHPRKAMQTTILNLASLILLTSLAIPAVIKAAPPARDPHTPGYVEAKDLPDGAVPEPNADGNFVIGATHKPAPEMMVHDDVPHGTVHQLTMSSADSKIYPGI